MQTSYATSMTTAINGRRATGDQCQAISRPYNKVVNIQTVSVGGTTDGTYTLTVDDGVCGAQSVSYVASSKTAAQIATGLAAAGEAVEALNNVASFVASTADVIITSLHAGVTLTIAFTSNPGTHMTLAVTQAAVRSRLRLGIGIVDLTGVDCRPPASGDTAARFSGVSEYSRDVVASDDVGASGETYDGYEEGSVVSILRRGAIWVEPEEAITALTDPVYMRCIATGTEKAGAFRKSDDGTAQVTTCTPTVTNSVEYQLQIHFTAGPAKGETHVIQYVSDGSAADTEIVTGLIASLNANARLAALITESGTTTLILTATDKGSTFEVDTIGVGGWASITTGTAGAPDCVDISAYARWGSIGSANAPVRLDVLLP